MLIFKKILT